MKRRGDYSDFQDRVFQEIRECEDIERQREAQIRVWVDVVRSAGNAFGLTEKEVVDALQIAKERRLDGAGLAYVMGLAAGVKRQQHHT